MASEYTEHFNLDLYTDNDRPNLRDQYNAAIRKIDNKLFEQVTIINLLDSTVDNLVEDVQQMHTDLDNETTARTNADTAINTRIDNETTARETADQTLTTNLSAEVTARQGADTVLENKIDTDVAAERTAREAADTTLENKIDTDVAAERTARQTADNNIRGELVSMIDNLQRRRIIVIGDSYYHGWWSGQQHASIHSEELREMCNAEYIKTMRTVSDAELLLNGSGFWVTGETGQTFQGQVENLHRLMTQEERDEITDVVFYGGPNDGTHYYDSQPSVHKNAIQNAIAAARQVFPNAYVLTQFVYAGSRTRSLVPTTAGNAKNYVKPAMEYRMWSNEVGVPFSWCNATPYMVTNQSPDTLHPSDEMVPLLRAKLAEFIVARAYTPDYKLTSSDPEGYFDDGSINHTLYYIPREFPGNHAFNSPFNIHNAEPSGSGTPGPTFMTDRINGLKSVEGDAIDIMFYATANTGGGTGWTRILMDVYMDAPYRIKGKLPDVNLNVPGSAISVGANVKYRTNGCDIGAFKVMRYDETCAVS